MESRSRPETQAPRGRPPRGCEPRNVRSGPPAGAGAAHLSAGGGAAADPAPRPRPSARLGPFRRLRRRSAPRPPLCSVPPSLPASLAPSLPPFQPGRVRGSGRRLGRGSFGAAASAHLGARSQPRAASPKLLPGKGCPGARAPHAPGPCPAWLDSWRLASLLRAVPREGERRGPGPGRQRPGEHGRCDGPTGGGVCPGPPTAAGADP